MSLFDEGFPLPPGPSLTQSLSQNSLELGKELPSCPCSQPQASPAWLMRSFELLHGGLEQKDAIEGSTDLRFRVVGDCKAGRLGLETPSSGFVHSSVHGAAHLL